MATATAAARRALSTIGDVALQLRVGETRVRRTADRLAEAGRITLRRIAGSRVRVLDGADIEILRQELVRVGVLAKD